MLSATELIVQAAQIVATAIGTYMACFAALDAKVRQSRKELGEQGQQIDKMMAECEAMKQQRKRDLERWSDGLAASFGTELEDISNRLMETMLACRHGEDVTAALFDIHDDLCMVVGDMLSMCPIEGE